MSITQLIGSFTKIINEILVPLVFTIAFLVFLWGVFQYFIAGGGDEEKRKKGREFILYGIIGFAVMVSVWGLVFILTETFGFSGKVRPELPGFDGSSGGSTGEQFVPAKVNNPFGPICYSKSDCPSGQECVDGNCKL